MSETKKKTKTLSFKTTQELYNKVNERCEKDNTTKQVFLEDSVERRLMSEVTTKEEFMGKQSQQKLMLFQQENRCPNCMATPFYDKNGRAKIVCTRPIFKQNRYGNWIPSNKSKGEIFIESCVGDIKYRLNKEKGIEQKEQSEIKLLKAKIVEQSKQIKKHREKDDSLCQETLENMSRHESIVCRLVDRVIPLAKCFETQDEQKELPEHFISIRERCPCGHFIHYEKMEMANYENPETVPFINAEIHKQYLKNVENAENFIVELKSIDNFEERKRLIDEYYEKHPIFEEEEKQ